jgi:8-oxo-dGTP pyrophosphatase MutT (NUDIX family)
VKTLYPLAVWANHVLRRHVDMAFAVGLEADQESAVIHLSAELLAYRWVSRDALPALLPEHVCVIDLALARRQEYRASNETLLAGEKEKKGRN